MGTSTQSTRGLRETARWAGADEATIEAAATCSEPCLVVSGRLASGKDTVAEAVMHALGRSDAVRISFATALRRELDELIDAVRADRGGDALAAVMRAGGVDAEQARTTTELLVAALAANPAVTSYDRTREIRLALQAWGTDVRRAQDGEWWVKQAMRDAVSMMADQRPVYVTDARFPNEVAAARGLGFLAVRLEVELPVRAARLMARDGLEIDPAAENHPSERELEGYQGFDLWVENSGPLETSVETIVSALKGRGEE